MNIFRLNKNYKNLTRLVKIITIITRYGFSAFLARMRSGLGIVPHRAFQAKPEASLSALTEPERIYFAQQPYALGILEAIEHYDFLTTDFRHD